MSAAETDAIDLREIAGTLRRGWRWVAGGVTVGLALALAAGALLPRSYEAKAVVVLRNSPDAGSSMLSRIGGLSGIADVLPVSLESDLDTELEILTSRAVLGAVVDSLGLQVQVVDPKETPTRAVLARWALRGRHRTERYTFRRVGDAFQVEGRGAAGPATPGVPYALPMGVVTLRAGELPAEFTLDVADREDAIDRLLDEVDAENTAGQIAEITYVAGDRATAAAVPNALVENYLHRRRTTDRGVNQRRFEFLERHADSVSTELARAEEALRRHQETTGMISPTLQGEAEIDRTAALRQELATVDVELGALRDLIAQSAAGTLSARRLAAYPTFLRNPAINDVLSRLMEVETERGVLLERRTEEDPEVIALTQNVALLEDQLRTLANAYVVGLERQGSSLRRELGVFRGELAVLPGQAKESLRLQRDVERLSETLLVLQGQLVQTRLAAIGEGGDVRRVDRATPPRRASFPKTWLNLVLGLFGGLVVGTVGALGSSLFGERVRDAHDVERFAGIPAHQLRPGSPLLLRGVAEWPAVVLLPVGAGAKAGAVARRVAESAALRGADVALVDLEDAASSRPGTAPGAAAGTGLVAVGAGEPTSTALAAGEGAGVPVYRAAFTAGAVAPAAVRVALEEMEQRFGTVVVALPGIDGRIAEALLSERRVVVLVGRAGELRRAELDEALAILARAGIPVAGIVLHNGHVDAGHGD